MAPDLKQSASFCFLGACHSVCGILVPGTGIKPVPCIGSMESTTGLPEKSPSVPPFKLQNLIKRLPVPHFHDLISLMAFWLLQNFCSRAEPGLDGGLAGCNDALKDMKSATHG